MRRRDFQRLVDSLKSLSPHQLHHLNETVSGLAQKNEVRALIARQVEQSGQCPYCDAKEFRRWGTTPAGEQRYRCKACAKTFTRLTGTPLSRVALATWLATSNLPLNDRQEVLGWGSADTWALPCVASLLLPALPSTERERLEQLPLATHPDDAEALNRALFQLYCPEMYPLMELAMTDGDWCARETIESWVTRLENIETEAFALPPDSPENNMAN